MEPLGWHVFRDCCIFSQGLEKNAPQACGQGVGGTTDFIPVVPEGGTVEATRRQISTLYKEELSKPLELFGSKWVAC